MDKIISYLTINAIMISQGSVLLSAKRHVKRYENVVLNCSSDTIPLGKTANLEVNGKSFTAITLLSTGECFSSILRNQCTPDVCACSSRGVWFSHIYDVVQHVGRINITCSMILKVHGSSSDSVRVNVIDFTGPTLRTDPELPFKAGTTASFICLTDTLSTNIQFKWECLGNNETMSVKAGLLNSTKYSSVIMNDINMNHDGNICRCCINVDGITAESEISVSIISTPIIQSTEIVTCNSSAVNLSCIIKTGLPLYGFNLWTHSVNGIQIRTLNGSMNMMNGKESILEVETCSFQEAGEYTCNAWNTHGGTSLVVNKNISLQVNNVIHIIGPHERCPSIPIYHSAPASGNTPNVYDLPNPGYLEVIDDASSYISTNHYAEID
ncbi:unnamed protein product [Mytilus edulis]|uniref:Ig-like domain-containing protein n=1 Tax=Mytilus edulis TaxID=6550 RepID=A0A8S3SHT1_MYTED|nr:unnamed protein product [Mytilus edulis]